MRCVNIDWLEVYCEESNSRYPCNADYFRRCGYFVTEREYGTRVYNEMFIIEDRHGNPWIEVRRNPKSGGSSFKGLSEFSTHIRLSNWVCYQDDCVSQLREFLVKHDYIFHRIFRIDICYDFEKFDSGDLPSRVAKKILEKKLLKINQGRISVHGTDNWARYEWETLSWGSPSSMVTTKMYNKSLEILQGGNKKPYIYTEWMMCDLLTNPMSLTKVSPDGSTYKPEIWRIEFSIRSKADSWLILNGKRKKKNEENRVPHNLSMFDAKDKLWQRFQDLAYHYFRFKVKTVKSVRKGLTALELNKIKFSTDESLQRKDRMPDKVLFDFQKEKQFAHVQAVPKPSKPNSQDEILKRRIEKFMQESPDREVKAACSTILKAIDNREVYRYTPDMDYKEVLALRAAISLKMNGDERPIHDLLNELIKLYKNQEIW